MYLKSLFEDVCIEKVIFTYEIYEIVTNLQKKEYLKDQIDKKTRKLCDSLMKDSVGRDKSEQTEAKSASAKHNAVSPTLLIFHRNAENVLDARSPPSKNSMKNCVKLRRKSTISEGK